MARQMLSKMPKIKVGIVPPPLKSDPSRLAPQVGTLADGTPLFELERIRTTNRPKLDPTTGKPMYTKNRMTGEDLIQKRELDWRYEKWLAVPNDEGNGNLSWIEYVPPSQEELDAAARQRAIEQAKDDLAAAFVDSGASSVAEFLASRNSGFVAVSEPAVTVGVSGSTQLRPAAPVESSDEGPDPETFELPEDFPFPQQKSPGRWQLSNGDVVQGKKVDAIAKETEIQRKAIADRLEELAAEAAIPSF